MPKLYSAREVLKALKRAGFVIVSQRVSHIKLKGLRKGRIHIVIVPNHKELARGTFSSILKQADMLLEEFKTYLKSR